MTGSSTGKTKVKTIIGQGGKGSCCMGNKETLKFLNHDPMAADNSSSPLVSRIEILNQEKGAGGREDPDSDTSCHIKLVRPTDLGPIEDLFNANRRMNQEGFGQSNEVGPEEENRPATHKAKSKKGGVGLLVENPKSKAQLEPNCHSIRVEEK
ncbi:hypothetical protein L6452_27379 [Arctium lappa]|uniref:Uncharacterized protein n=1 Tax=Arctium lappa TaxID=4217 RepID=A0ACB8ZXK0_ARCLA|nr:hypothetical protein L6452_27379 [Arctium lappa]